MLRVLTAVACVTAASLHAEELTNWMVDMSSHNSKIALTRDMTFQDNNTAIRLIIHRVTIGSYKPPRQKGDSQFARRAREASAADLLFGAYHAAYPSSDAVTQANGFLTAVSNQCVAGQKVILALDWEHVCVEWSDPSRKTKCTREGLVPPDFVLAFASRVKDVTSKQPLIYTSSRTLRQFGDFFRARKDVAMQLSALPLWIARYKSRQGHSFPTEAEIFPWEDWVFWQFAEGKGVGPTRRVSLRLQNLPIDTNYYNGSRSEIEPFFTANAWKCGGPAGAGAEVRNVSAVGEGATEKRK